MDKQTAIDLLDNLLGMVEDNHESDYDAALHMGIDALKSNAPNALSALDCVERQAALHYIADWQYGEAKVGNETVYDTIEKCYKMIEQLPSVQPESTIGQLNADDQSTKTDVISRQAAISALIRKRQPVNNGDGTITITMLADEVIRDVLNELPSVQPQRMRGRWVSHPEIGWGETWLCSECGEKTTSSIMGTPRYNWCPMCGADMRGTE